MSTGLFGLLFELNVLVLFLSPANSFRIQHTLKQQHILASSWERNSKRPGLDHCLPCISSSRRGLLRTFEMNKRKSLVPCFGQSQTDDCESAPNTNDRTDRNIDSMKHLYSTDESKKATVYVLTSLFISGALLGPWLDGYHGKFGVLTYANPKNLFVFGNRVLTTDWWVPPLFGVAGVLIGSLYLIFDEVFKIDEEKRSPSGPLVCVTIAVFTFQYYLSGLLVLAFSNFLLQYGGTSTNVDTSLFLNTLGALLLAIAALGWYKFDRTKSGLLVSLITAIGGPVIEVFIINCLHLYRYNQVPVQPPAMQAQHQHQHQHLASSARSRARYMPPALANDAARTALNGDMTCLVASNSYGGVSNRGESVIPLAAERHSLPPPGKRADASNTGFFVGAVSGRDPSSSANTKHTATSSAGQFTLPALTLTQTLATGDSGGSGIGGMVHFTATNENNGLSGGGGYWFGIPVWICPVYFLGGPAVGNLGRLYANAFKLRNPGRHKEKNGDEI